MGKNLILTTQTRLEKAMGTGLRWQYASPIFLEMFYSLYRSGLPPLAGIQIEDETERLLNEPNILLRGVALRLPALLCIPILVKNEAKGVLYYDNSYVGDCFEMLDIDNLDEIAVQLSGFIERLFLLFTKMRTLETMPHESTLPSKSRKLITQSPAVETLLVQAGQVAKTSSSVLILGETGVGKELLARHIHTESNRVNKPFIVIDPSTMPESLVESELFGHEKDIDLSKTNEAVLTAYHWPGNIRELKNVMERTVLLSPDDNLEFNLPQTMSNEPAGPNPFDDLPTMEEIQKRYILHVLEKTDGKQSGPDDAARILGMKRATLYNRMKKLGL